MITTRRCRVHGLNDLADVESHKRPKANGPEPRLRSCARRDSVDSEDSCPRSGTLQTLPTPPPKATPRSPAGPIPIPQRWKRRVPLNGRPTAKERFYRTGRASLIQDCVIRRSRPAPRCGRQIPALPESAGESRGSSRRAFLKPSDNLPACFQSIGSGSESQSQAFQKYFTP